MRFSGAAFLIFCWYSSGFAQQPTKVPAANNNGYGQRSASRKPADNGAGKYDFQLDSLKNQIALLKRRQDVKELIKTFSCYVQYCEKAGQRQAMLDANREILAHSVRISDKYLQAVSMNNIGKLLYVGNHFDSALFYQFKAIQLSEELKNDSLIAESAQVLGALYNNRKDYWKGFHFCEKAAAHAESRGKKDAFYVTCLGNKALALSWLKKYKESISLEEELLPVAEKQRDYIVISTIKMNRASNYVSLGDCIKARRYLNELVAQMPYYPVTPFYRTNNMAIIGMIYWDMKESGKAKQILRQQIAPAKKLQFNALLQRIYDTLSVVEETVNNFKQALEYKKEAQLYKALLDKEVSEKLFSEMDVKYKTTEKEKALSQKQLELIQKDFQLQKNRHYMYYIFAALIVALLVTALLLILYRHKKVVHVREMEAIQQQKELQLLQALMEGEEKERSRIAKDLHDGVSGMLAAVKMHLSSMPEADDLVQTEGYRQGMKLLNEAAQEIRKTSHNLMPEVLLQHGLDEALRRYCNNVNNNKALKIIYDSWGKTNRLAGSFELSVYRIVQELINNIIKHSNATQAMVQLTQQDDLLSIAIEDNGVGFAKDSAAEGMGLHNLQSRIRAMNGKLEMQTSEQNGVSVYLEFEIAALKKEITIV